MKKWFCALLFISAPSFANTYMFDHSDLWWNSSESGWGVTVTHQKEFIFLTFFLYAPDGRAAWYTGQAFYSTRTDKGEHLFTGAMYQVSGPWFGSTFNPALVGAREVGKMTFTAFANSATLTYNIDGVTVTKKVTRQTLRRNEINAVYRGTTKTVQSGCNPTSLNGTYLVNTTLGIQNSDTTLRMVSLGAGNPPDQCTYTGDWRQTGRLGVSFGTFSCSNGANGTYEAGGVDANITGLTAFVESKSNACASISTTFGGVFDAVWIK